MNEHKNTAPAVGAAQGGNKTINNLKVPQNEGFVKGRSLNLISLNLQNFRGCKHYNMAFGCKRASIYGANGAGKSTLADGYTWLLTGKDQQGRSDYEILPVGSAEGIESSVTASFSNSENGDQFTLRRVYKPVFTRKRGESEKHRTGNTTDYYINDVPYKAGDYSKFIEEHIGTEEDILTVSRVDYFAQVMKPDARRQKLLDLFANGVDDQSVILNHSELAPLGELLGTYTMDDCVKRWKAQRRKVNENKDAIPGRIDEAERAKPDIESIETDSARLPKLAAERLKIRSKIDSMRSGESAAGIRKEISKLQADAEQARADYIRKSSGDNTALENQISVLRKDLSDLQAKAAKSESSASSEATLAAGLKKEIEELRQKAFAEHDKEFDAENGKCPTCGQPYPPEMLEEMRGNFNAEKAENLTNLSTHGKELKSTYNELKKQVQFDSTAAKQAQFNADHLQQKLLGLQKMFVTPPAWEMTSAYADFQKQIADAKHSLEVISSASDKQVQTLQADLASIDSEINDIQQRKSNLELIKRQDARIEELKAQEKKLGNQLAQLDNLLYLADRFVQLKASDVEAEVNESFHSVRWKLFETQVNGGVKACCEAQVNGKDYGSLSNAEKVNAGLDIVNTLGQKMGLILPVWIDNAESISHPMEICAQIINLYVSDQDQQLRTEVKR
jgi:DNA repair exonuclease SbcCD ATPase subunit